MMAILRMTICWHLRRLRLRLRLQHLPHYLGVSILYLPFQTFHRQCLMFQYILLLDHHPKHQTGAGADLPDEKFLDLLPMVNHHHHLPEAF